MLANEGTNQAADWWAVGVLIFELVARMPPFTHPHDMQLTFENIARGTIHWDKKDWADVDFSPALKSLVGGLCTKRVAERLGYQQAGAEDVIAHEWFESVDFDALVNRTKTPPWTPRLKSPDDTSYFDQEAMADILESHSDGLHMTDADNARWSTIFDQFGSVSTGRSAISPPMVTRTVLTSTPERAGP